MNILIFGPNGSGKGTLGAKIKEKYPVAHIESGAIFRENIKGGTELGKAAKAYIDKGDLVPDDITIPMILDRLQKDDCKKGWLLDGFPRNKVQAQKLDEALKAKGIKLDYVVEILLDRQTAKNRIMGRSTQRKNPSWVLKKPRTCPRPPIFVPVYTARISYENFVAASSSVALSPFV